MQNRTVEELTNFILEGQVALRQKNEDYDYDLESLHNKYLKDIVDYEEIKEVCNLYNFYIVFCYVENDELKSKPLKDLDFIKEYTDTLVFTDTNKKARFDFCVFRIDRPLFPRRPWAAPSSVRPD